MQVPRRLPLAVDVRDTRATSAAESPTAPATPAQGNQVLPIMWRNYFQMTGMDMLTHLRAGGPGA